MRSFLIITLLFTTLHFASSQESPEDIFSEEEETENLPDHEEPDKEDSEEGSSHESKPIPIAKPVKPPQVLPIVSSDKAIIEQCNAADLPAELVYKMTDFIENYFEGESTQDEVGSDLDTISAENVKCHDAFNLFKNHSYQLMDQDDENLREDADIVFKTMVRILNEKLKELILLKKLLKDADLLTLQKDKYLLTLTANEIEQGNIPSAAEKFRKLQKYGMKANDVVLKSYHVENIENILRFLDRLPDVQLEGTAALFDNVIVDESLSNATAKVFDQFLVKFAKTPSPGRTVAGTFVYHGMRLKLKEKIAAKTVSDEDKAALVAKEIQNGAVENAVRRYKVLSAPKIEKVIDDAFAEDTVYPFMLEFLGEMEEDVKENGSIALLDQIIDAGLSQAVQADHFANFLESAAKNASSRRSKLIFDGLKSTLKGSSCSKQPDFDGPEIHDNPYSSDFERRKKFGRVKVIQPQPGLSVLPVQVLLPTTTCSSFNGRASRLEFQTLLPLRNPEWNLTFSFRSNSPDGLLFATENEQFNLVIFLKDGRVLFSSSQHPCMQTVDRYLDGQWHNLVVHLFPVDRLEVYVDNSWNKWTTYHSDGSSGLHHQIRTKISVIPLEKRNFYFGHIPNAHLQNFATFDNCFEELVSYYGDIKDIKVNGVPSTNAMKFQVTPC